MKQRSLTGWITKAYKWMLDKIFRSFIGSKISSKYGVSFDPSISLSALPTALPNVNDFFMVATDVAYFEVIATSKEKNVVVIREVGTETEHTIDPVLFELLFIKIDKPIVSMY